MLSSKKISTISFTWVLEKCKLACVLVAPMVPPFIWFIWSVEILRYFIFKFDCVFRRKGPAPFDTNGQLHQFIIENEWWQGSNDSVQLHCTLARCKDDCNQKSVEPKVDDQAHYWRDGFKLVARAGPGRDWAANVEARWVYLSPLDDDSSQSQTSGTYSFTLIWQIDSTPLSTHSRE